MHVQQLINMISQCWHHGGTQVFTKSIYLSFLYDRYMFEIRVLEVLLPNIPGASCNVLIQVEPGKPGAEVSKKKKYKSKKKFAYRMCTG